MKPLHLQLESAVLPLLPVALRGFTFPLMLIVLLPVMWLITDVLAGGYSPGRVAMGLTMSDAAGKNLSFARRITRFMGKFLCFGLAGLHPGRLAQYDRIAGTVWRSPLARPSVTEWRLVFVNGAYAGKGGPLADLPGFDPARPIRVGRDVIWAQIKLKDVAVSNQHCEILLQKDGALIRDLGSNNGTYVEGRRIAANTWVTVGEDREIAIATQRMVLRR